METEQELMTRYGLIGRQIAYSFSRSYFAEKFAREEIVSSYVNFDCTSIAEVEQLLQRTNISGFNVTIPYKQEVIAFLDDLDVHATEIGAVNTVKRLNDGKLIGFNTDHLGFRDALLEVCGDMFFDGKEEESFKALILGTGGASKAVVYALEKLGVDCQYVSRKASETCLSYKDLNREIMLAHTIIVNCTPVGTYPDIDDCPEIPYAFLTTDHIVYDLIYNPLETTFLRKAKAKSACTINGLRMLELQAEASWNIWNTP